MSQGRVVPAPVVSPATARVPQFQPPAGSVSGGIGSGMGRLPSFVPPNQAAASSAPIFQSSTSSNPIPPTESSGVPVATALPPNIAALRAKAEALAAKFNNLKNTVAAPTPPAPESAVEKEVVQKVVDTTGMSGEDVIAMLAMEVEKGAKGPEVEEDL